MSTTMHELLTSAVANRERSLDEGHSFAREHGAPVRRAIQTRRVATYAGTGTVATLATLGTIYGFQAWSAGATNPAGGVPSTPDEATTLIQSNKVTTTLVPVPIDESVYGPTATDRLYVYYATRGGEEMVPFPPSGIYYPGIDDVAADAFIVTINGGLDGYDLEGPNADREFIGAFSMVSDQGDLVGERSNAIGPIMWENIGHVSSTTEWGVRYYLVDGRLVSVGDGEANPNAVEVVAMFEPPAGS
ncbi:hypothetical protein [Demequina sp.]|uniref:hypothetical protein n=1 Tax=Demequina sp. TaxID=2050685 RepID=UPI0025BE9BFA|nr:hypothetical protein [Demequina sp.]